MTTRLRSGSIQRMIESAAAVLLGIVLAGVGVVVGVNNSTSAELPTSEQSQQVPVYDAS